MGGITFTEDDLTAANRANLRLWAASRRSLGVWLIVLLVIILSVLGLTDGLRWPTAAVLLAVAGFAGVVGYLRGTRRIARRQLRETAALAAPVQYSWDDRRFRAAGANGTTDMPWRDLHAWHRYPHGYLLFPSSLLSYPVPDRIFGADAEEAVLRHGLTAAGVPERRPFRRMQRRAG